MITDRNGKPVFAYKHGPPRAQKKRDDPEARLQKAVVEYLTYALPRGEYRVRAGLEGAKRTGKARADFKAMGGAPGWPDLMLFNRKSRAYRWIELKWDKNDTTDVQDDVHADLKDHVAVCWSIEDVEAALIRWGVTPRVPISKAHRYAV